MGSIALGTLRVTLMLSGAAFLAVLVNVLLRSLSL